MTFLISTTSTSFSPETGANRIEDATIAEFRLLPGISQLLNSFFEMLTNLLPAERVELWFAQSFPPRTLVEASNLNSASDSAVARPQLWRIKSNASFEATRMLRLEMPIRIENNSVGLVAFYFAPETVSYTDSSRKGGGSAEVSAQLREAVRLAVVHLEIGLGLTLKLQAAKADTEPENIQQFTRTVAQANQLSISSSREELIPALQLEFSRATRHNLNLGVMLIRMDLGVVQQAIANSTMNNVVQLELSGAGFGRNNGNNGESQSEQMARHLAYLSRKYLRVSDAVYHYDDNHLAVILPHTNELQAYRAAEKLLDMLDSQSIFGHVGLAANNWLALGISSFPYLSNNPEALIKHCQQALVRVKHVPYSAARGREVMGLPRPTDKASPLPIQIWKATKMMSTNEINHIGDEQAVRAVMRGFQFVDLRSYLEQLGDVKKRARLKTVFDMIAPDMVRQHQVAALSVKKLAGSDALTVAMADPSNASLVASLARATDCNIIAVTARSDQLNELIENLLV